MEAQTKQTTWAIDPVHTKIRFDAKYLLMSAVSGWFREFEGTVVSEHNDFTDCSIQLTIYTQSLYTGNEERDNHLRSADFFDARQYPTIQFTSTGVSVQNGDVHIKGLLSVKDVQQEYAFTARFLGTCHDPIGNTKAGFEMDTLLNRKDFHINWNQWFDTNGLLLSDEVKVHCDLQLLKISK
jgi:polyisoprenoid-binding protein YceI